MKTDHDIVKAVEAGSWLTVIRALRDENVELKARLDNAEAVLVANNGLDGAHHKDWIIDQALRAVCAEGYTETVKALRDGEDGPNTYAWEEGIAP